jgi:hypothetical protein
MKTIYAVMAEDSHPSYPRYFTSLDAAKQYAKRAAKISNLSSWITEIRIPSNVPDDGVKPVLKVREEEYLSDSD